MYSHVQSHSPILPNSVMYSEFSLVIFVQRLRSEPWTYMLKFVLFFFFSIILNLKNEDKLKNKDNIKNRYDLKD